jgi:hypothetical protein
MVEDSVVYHAYSTYAHGLDGLWGMYQWLDRAPKGRNETGLWWQGICLKYCKSQWNEASLRSRRNGSRRHLDTRISAGLV